MSEEKHKPALDEQTLAKLLEAAYVLQEHNREVQALELGLDLKRDQIESEEKAKAAAAAEIPSTKAPQPASQGDYTFTLAQIVSTQHQIQLRSLDLEKTMALVTERVTDIARADGAAIGIVEGKKILYRAVSGPKAPAAGTEVASEKALCLPCIRNGQVFRCGDVDPEFLIDTQECRRRGIQSLIAIPIFHGGTVAGGLEVYYSKQHGFSDQDVHSCQLMAGLVTEALARDDELTWKKSLENERAMMLEALEKLKPKLSALVDSPVAAAAPAPPRVSVAAAASYTCPKCGHPLVGGEQFCGQCGAPRNGAVRPEMASPPAREAAKVTPSSSISAPITRKVDFPPAPNSPPEEHPQEFLADTLEEQLANLFSSEAAIEKRGEDRDDRKEPAEPLNQSLAEALPADLEISLVVGHEGEVILESAANEEATEKEEEEEEEENEAEPPEQLALVEAKPAAQWSSAASAREYLEQLALGGKQRGALARFWDARRGDIYLAIAVMLVACVIRWGIWSNRPVSATGAPGTTAAAQHKSADADLSVFDRMLISLGLAEAPEAPVDNGNPSVRVWVDLQTALYYCPGTDLYGKTAKGKYATQRDAQLDEYQPAYRKPCN
ncbi:MAG: GAF domain-containing protein [Candidatus Sulfotelmatobacter sp.]